MHNKLKYTLVKMNISTEERYQLAYKSKLEENDNSIIFYLSFCPRDCLMTVKLNATSSEFHPNVCFGNITRTTNINCTQYTTRNGRLSIFKTRR